MKKIRVKLRLIADATMWLNTRSDINEIVNNMEFNLSIPSHMVLIGNIKVENYEIIQNKIKKEKNADF